MLSKNCNKASIVLSANTTPIWFHARVNSVWDDQLPQCPHLSGFVSGGNDHLHIGVPDKNSFARAKKDHDKVTQKRDHLITSHVLDCLEPYLEAIFLSKSFRVINVSSYHWRIWRFSRNYRKLDLGHETRRSQFTLYTHF